MGEYADKSAAGARRQGLSPGASSSRARQPAARRQPLGNRGQPQQLSGALMPHPMARLSPISAESNLMRAFYLSLFDAHHGKKRKRGDR